MISSNKIATVFGGTGFIGRHVVRNLARAGYTVKIATRVPERAYFLRPCGHVGQVVPFACDYNDPESIAASVRGAEAVVNCIGILHERRKGDFRKIHTEMPAAIARACRAEKVKSLVHISALGIEQDRSRYAQTKLAGEKAVREDFPDAAILRPSVVFGAEDAFFNKFARLSALLPALPLIGGGKTRFQPVYAGDVADAVSACIDRHGDARGKTYELGGPEVLDFREIYERLFIYTGRRRALVSLPWRLARVQAFFMERLPKPLLTRDQVESLKSDHVAAPQAPGLADLGLTPTAMSLVLPGYLESYRRGGRFADSQYV